MNIIKSFGSTNRLQPLGEALFMLRMEINVGYGFLLFGFTRDTVISLFTIVFALTEIKIIAMILNRQNYQFGLADRVHSILAHGTEWNTSKLLFPDRQMHSILLQLMILRSGQKKIQHLERYQTFHCTTVTLIIGKLRMEKSEI